MTSHDLVLAVDQTRALDDVTTLDDATTLGEGDEELKTSSLPSTRLRFLVSCSGVAPGDR